MRKITTRLISAALAASMMLSACPVSAFAAAGGQAPEYGVATQAGTDINPVTSYTYYIESSGTYNLSGGSYTTSSNSIYITATGDVTLNITGNITVTGSKAFINVDSACNLTINGVYNGVTYKISQTSTTGKANVVNNPGGATITFNGGIYEAKTDGGGPVVANAAGGTINAKNATFRVTGTSDAGQAFNNTDSTLNIYDGTVIDNGTMVKWTCIVGGTVNMYGGTITAGAKASAATGVVDGAVLAGIVGVQAYALGTEAYIRLAMPAGIILPSNRMEMALLIWEQAGEPEPTSTELFEDISADDADAQKAARWMVEQELMKVDEDKPAEFHPLKAVTRLRICLTWHDAKEKGLVK